MATARFLMIVSEALVGVALSRTRFFQRPSVWRSLSRIEVSEYLFGGLFLCC
jgi:hypothetical protein